MQPVFRFAPSPNGYLHLGHAYSALLNARLAREQGGRFLLRIEDIDTVRCTPEKVAACEEDLAWLGLAWEQPVLRQSTQFPRYQAAAETLRGRGVLYPCFCTRGEISRAAGEAHDPDGAPLYPGTCKHLSAGERATRLASGKAHQWRLDMGKALDAVGALAWEEARDELLLHFNAMPAQAERWGDVVLLRKDCPTSYHLAVVLDDAAQGISHVVRGADLYAATGIHRVLQGVLGLPAPRYFHHGLIKDEAGKKLAKSAASTPLRQLRVEGMSAAQIRASLGFA